MRTVCGRSAVARSHLFVAVSVVVATVCTVGLAAGAPTAAAATSGLVAAYSFDEGSGASSADASGNGNDGVVSGRFGRGRPAWWGVVV